MQQHGNVSTQWNSKAKQKQISLDCKILSYSFIRNKQVLFFLLFFSTTLAVGQFHLFCVYGVTFRFCEQKKYPYFYSMAKEKYASSATKIGHSWAYCVLCRVSALLENLSHRSLNIDPISKKSDSLLCSSMTVKCVSHMLPQWLSISPTANSPEADFCWLSVQRHIHRELVASSSSSCRSRWKYHLDYSATVLRYLCVFMLSPVGPSLIERCMDTGSLKCAVVLVGAVYTKARQALTSLH